MKASLLQPTRVLVGEYSTTTRFLQQNEKSIEKDFSKSTYLSNISLSDIFLHSLCCLTKDTFPSFLLSPSLMCL